jgi:4-hydroxy-3-polyprenylbenzoate decarboxylase
MDRNIIMGITGASGSIYAKNFIRHAGRLNLFLRVVASSMGESVFRHETNSDVRAVLESADCKFRIYDNRDMFADIASGSCRTGGMVILPCSMKTLSSVAAGTSGSLLERAADVTLKERRTLILAVRETPLSLIHLKNMVSAAEAGAVILPASPGFYHSPSGLDSLADFISARIFDQLGIDHGLNTAWHEK